MLLGIIPGNGRKEMFHIDPYMQLVVDELLTLSECHVYYPTYMTAPVRIKAKLLQYVFDFPGISKVMNQPASGSIKACPWCEVSGVYSKALHKTIYLENRRYLKDNHALRNSENFMVAETRKEPTRVEPVREKDLRNTYDRLPNEAQKKKFAREHGVKGTYALMQLPYHKYSEHIQPDGMHTVTDVVQHILDWICGNKCEEQLLNAENEVPTKKRRREDAVSPLSLQEKQRGNKRCRGLLFPKGCSGYKGDVFTEAKRTLKKTHGWTEVRFRYFF